MTVSILDHHLDEFERAKERAEEAIEAKEYDRAERALQSMVSHQYEVAIEADNMQEAVDELEMELDERKYDDI